MTDNTVAIMMATYNGEQYIEEQIQSLQKQTYSDWVLFVRDDGRITGYRYYHPFPVVAVQKKILP